MPIPRKLTGISMRRRSSSFNGNRRASEDAEIEDRILKNSPSSPLPSLAETDTDSPTSIVTVPLSDRSTPSQERLPLRECSVNVYEPQDGSGNTEVSLTPTKTTTPQPKQHNMRTTKPIVLENISRPMRALLDAEATPSPPNQKRPVPVCVSPTRISLLSYEEEEYECDDEEDDRSSSTPRRLPFCGMIMQQTSSGNCCHRVGDSLDLCTQSQAHRKIVSLLSPYQSSSSNNSNNNDTQATWQMWSLNPSEAPHSFDSSRSSNTEGKAHLHRVLQNRAFHMKARKNRLSSLKENMHFERTATPDLFKTRSFSVGPAFQAASRKGLTAEKPKRDFLFWNFGNCGEDQVDDDDDASFHVDVDDSYCYDSDPEEFLRRPFQAIPATSRSTSNNNGRPRKGRNESVADDSVLLYDDNKENIPPSFAADKYDEDLIKRTIQNFMNEKWILLLHHEGTSRAVHAWTERGHRLHRHVIPPKLRWRRANPQKPHNSARRGSTNTPLLPDSMNVLDIYRILAPPPELDQTKYPFAKQHLLVQIKTIDTDAMLEFRTTTARDRFVRGIKLLIARLGSLLVVGDDHLDEFFNNPDHTATGPGEAPYWLQEEDDDDLAA